MHIEKKSDKCKIKRAKAIIQVKETIMQKVKDKIIPIILIAIMAVSGYKIVTYFYQAHEQKKIFTSIEKKIDNNQKGLVKAKGNNIQKKYAKLYEENSDFVGWIKIKGTKINYPVMQSKDNPDFYLKHGFDKAYTDYGCPYVQENCDMELPSDNIIIYGHHMNDGSMFAGLMKFKDKSFWEKHKTVSFDTLTDRQTYEVIAVFKTVVYTDSPDSFKYYQFVNADTAEDFTAYVEKGKKLSLYETGITAEYGDKLLTLSTCEYSRTNGRLVVVAKLINE